MISFGQRRRDDDQRPPQFGRRAKRRSTAFTPDEIAELEKVISQRLDPTKRSNPTFVDQIIEPYRLNLNGGCSSASVTAYPQRFARSCVARPPSRRRCSFLPLRHLRERV